MRLVEVNKTCIYESVDISIFFHLRILTCSKRETYCQKDTRIKIIRKNLIIKNIFIKRVYTGRACIL